MAQATQRNKHVLVSVNCKKEKIWQIQIIRVQDFIQLDFFVRNPVQPTTPARNDQVRASANEHPRLDSGARYYGTVIMVSRTVRWYSTLVQYVGTVRWYSNSSSTTELAGPNKNQNVDHRPSPMQYSIEIIMHPDSSGHRRHEVACSMLNKVGAYL